MDFSRVLAIPKAFIFFVSLIPGFIDPTRDIILQSIVYGAVFIVLDVISIHAYAFLATATFKSTVFRSLNHNIIGALGLSAIGMFLIARGLGEVKPG